MRLSGVMRGGIPKKDFPRKHDIIFRYSKSDDYFYRPEYRPYSEGTVQRGRTAVKGKYAQIGLRAEGTPVNDWWIDIKKITSPTDPENTGYPTQKTVALMRRIIETSSEEGDLVLDPFCGCGTTVIAASVTNREWIGIDQSPRKPGELPTAFKVVSDRSHSLFQQAKYVSRDLEEVRELAPHQFEAWVNEFYKAKKPSQDKGVDGITLTGIPIQAKASQINYTVLSQFVTDARLHPSVPQPVKEVIVASQVGFDDSARKRAWEIGATDGVVVRLESPGTMVKLED